MLTYLSLFDGIGAACVAWEPLGWKCVGVSEIEQFAVAVTSHHRPHVPHLGDVTKITEEQVAALGRIDLIVGGFPCQDLSVAGKRAGLRNLDGSITRSGLFFAAMRIVRWAREHCGLRWLLIENVPGLYSSNRGRDFAAVVGEMVGAEFDVPNGGWRNAGFAVGPEGLCEWATLDAQFFNLAQRRVRVFALADFGDWSNRPPVLLEPESLSGHPAPRREAGEESAVCPTLRAGGNSTGGDRPPGTDVDTADSLQVVAFAHMAAGTQTRLGYDPESGTAPTLSRCQTAAVAFTQNSRSEVRQIGGDGQITGALTAEAGAQQQTYLAFQSSQSGVRTGDTHATLDANNGARRHNGVVAGSAVRRLIPLECERLQGFPDNYTRIPMREYARRRITNLRPADMWEPLPNGGWLLMAADGPRYKALGNSMAVPCMAWLGRRINAVEAMTAHESTWVAIKDAPEKEEA